MLYVFKILHSLKSTSPDILLQHLHNKLNKSKYIIFACWQEKCSPKREMTVLWWPGLFLRTIVGLLFPDPVLSALHVTLQNVPLRKCYSNKSPKNCDPWWQDVDLKNTSLFANAHSWGHICFLTSCCSEELALGKTLDLSEGKKRSYPRKLDVEKA